MHLCLFMFDAVLAILFITLSYMFCNFSLRVRSLKMYATQFRNLLLHMNLGNLDALSWIWKRVHVMRMSMMYVFSIM